MSTTVESRKYYSYDDQDTCEKNEELVLEISTLLEEIEHLKKFRSLHKSCESNLDAATKNLQIASKKLEKFTNSAEVFHLMPKENYTTNVVCKSLKNSSVCSVVDLKVPFTTFSIENIKNETGEVILGQNISKLLIDVQQTLFLPSNIADHFTNLTEFSVTASGLYLIDSNTFRNMNELKMLNLSNNKLLEIPRDAFTDLENLVDLDLSSNNIEGLEDEVFKSQIKLMTIKLNDNKLAAVNSKVFKDVRSLNKLFLENNKIKLISADLFLSLNRITVVNLINNTCINATHPEKSLQAIEIEIIDNCIAPIELFCDYAMTESEDEISYTCKVQNLTIEFPKTKISKVTGSNSIDLDINNVTVIEFSDQYIKFMPFELGKHFTKVAKLSVERSNLSSLHEVDFKDFPELKTIVIRHNNLTSIDKKSFDKVKQITHLDLSNNFIQSLPSKIFTSLVHLKTLVLSNNCIKKFTANLLPIRNAIEVLKADNNELELIETKILRYLRKSNLIDLTGNVCIDLKFDKMDQTTKTLIELSGEIDLNCSLEDLPEDSECN